MEVQAQIQALRQQFADELARRDSQINTLSSTITSLQATVASLLNASATSVSSSKRPKRQLPDPPKFDGTQSRYDTWLAQIELVIGVDGDAIGDAQAQFAFVYLRLESSPAALCLETLKHANLTKEFDYRRILDQLDRHNGVENKVQRAKAKLHKLEQGTGSFYKFLVSFEVTLGEAGGWNWDDERKVDTLRPCLSDYLKRKLQEHDVAGTTPTTYFELVSLCKRYASSGTPSTQSSAPGPSSGTSRQLFDYKAADKMDLSAVQIDSINTAPRRSSGSCSRHSSRSSSIDRSHCYRCGATDHYVTLCPIQPNPVPAQAAPTTVPLVRRKQWGIRRPASDQEGGDRSDNSDVSDNESDGSGFFWSLGTSFAPGRG